jgi:phosphoribosyl-AMP cyclohydrolase
MQAIDPVVAASRRHYAGFWNTRFVRPVARPHDRCRPFSSDLRNVAFMAVPSAQLPNFSLADGLLPAIAQDAETGEVLMMAWMNAESFAETLASGRACYFSRSRGRLWRKGEESGHVQLVREVLVDCDGDAILLKVEQQGGAACHTGYRSCFYRRVTPEGTEVVGQKVFDPKQVYGKD